MQYLCTQSRRAYETIWIARCSNQPYGFRFPLRRPSTTRFTTNSVARLSDEGCAGGRAQSGLYTGTNANCAKKCVREGKKIVFVASDHKRLLTISNQDSATENVGDYVEIADSLDEQAKTLQVTSLKLLEKGRAMCGVPKKKS